MTDIEKRIARFKEYPIDNWIDRNRILIELRWLRENPPETIEKNNHLYVTNTASWQSAIDTIIKMLEGK